MAKINDLPLLSNPTEDMYCLVGKDDLKKVPWSAIMGADWSTLYCNYCRRNDRQNKSLCLSR